MKLMIFLTLDYSYKVKLHINIIHANLDRMYINDFEF